MREGGRVVSWAPALIYGTLNRWRLHNPTMDDANTVTNSQPKFYPQ